MIYIGSLVFHYSHLDLIHLSHRSPRAARYLELRPYRWRRAQIKARALRKVVQQQFQASCTRTILLGTIEWHRYGCGGYGYGYGYGYGWEHELLLHQNYNGYGYGWEPLNGMAGSDWNMTVMFPYIGSVISVDFHIFQRG